MMSLVLVGVLCAIAFHFFGPVALIVLGAAFLLKGNK